MRSSVLAVLVLAFALAGPAEAHGDRHVRYIAAGGPLGEGAPCASTPYPDLDVGGACDIQVHLGTLNVTVDDATLGALGFAWTLRDAAGNVCASDEADIWVELAIVMPCRYITVIPAEGATTGEIVLAHR